MTQTHVPSRSHSPTRLVHCPGKTCCSLKPVPGTANLPEPLPLTRRSVLLHAGRFMEHKTLLRKVAQAQGGVLHPRPRCCLFSDTLFLLQQTLILDNSGNYFNSIRTILNWCWFFAFRFQQGENPSSDSLHASTPMHLLLKSIDWKLPRLFNWKQLRGIDNVPK